MSIAANETPENSSTTTKTLVTKSGLFLALLLMDILGRLESFVLKYGNAESSAQTVTESTPSSSKVTSPTPKSNALLGASRQNTSLTYDNPFDFMHDLVNKKIPPNTVTLEQFLYGSMVAMIEGYQPEMKIELEYGNNWFQVYQRVRKISPPQGTKERMETRQ